MQKEQFAVEPYVTADEVKQIRKKLGLTQKEFAQLIGSSKPTIERWETSNGKITGPLVLLIRMLNENPAYVERLRIPEQTLPVRMWYMYKNEICTLIDVDESSRIVRIKNYTNETMFRAFGNNDYPTYEEYKEFLESRCFPRTRDKMKLVLEDLEIPFYDPYLIIKKTKGRMAEDDFWIQID